MIRKGPQNIDSRAFYHDMHHCFLADFLVALFA